VDMNERISERMKERVLGLRLKPVLDDDMGVEEGSDRLGYLSVSLRIGDEVVDPFREIRCDAHVSVLTAIRFQPSG